MICPEITMVVRTYQVCALTMFALRLYTVRQQLYKSCTMMFALVSIIYPRIAMVNQYTDIREHLQIFNIDYLGTSKMDIS